MTRRRPAAFDAPGQDSFLDIVANLVGILIILVIVIGVRAKDAMVEAAPLSAETEREQSLDLATAKAATTAVETDIHQLSAKIAREQLEIEYRRRERDKIELLLAAGKQAIDETRNTLDTEQQAQFDVQRDVLAAQQELHGLQTNIQAAEGAIAKTEVIEHLPTPMAKTVFVKEIHFRLLNGNIAYVPMDEFAEKFKNDAPQKLWRLKSADSFVETIGPIDGFLIKYEIERTRVQRQTRVGAAIQQRIGLAQFVFLPVEEPLGEPLAEALQPGSQFQAILAANDPDKTTITVWTYPDSFDEFRTLKKVLFERGYLTASRPLPMGMHISGSPRGTRSAAQ